MDDGHGFKEKTTLVDSSANKQGEGEVYPGSAPLDEVKIYSCLFVLYYR
jgi:hypothetical protein